MFEGIEVPEKLYWFFGSWDHGSIESKKETTQRYDQTPDKDFVLHVTNNLKPNLYVSAGVVI